MKIKLLLAALLIVPFCLRVLGGTPEQEKAFVEKYRTAFEKDDKATLESFLYTKDANPMALEFYKMMITDGAGAKLTKIELVDLTPDEVKKAAEVQTGPDGSKAKLPLTPTKKLKIAIEKKDENGSSTSSSESFVAEKDGKYVIPVPATAK
jgi:predicted secreted protein